MIFMMPPLIMECGSTPFCTGNQATVCKCSGPAMPEGLFQHCSLTPASYTFFVSPSSCFLWPFMRRICNVGIPFVTDHSELTYCTLTSWVSGITTIHWTKKLTDYFWKLLYYMGSWIKINSCEGIRLRFYLLINC